MSISVSKKIFILSIPRDVLPIFNFKVLPLSIYKQVFPLSIFKVLPASIFKVLPLSVAKRVWIFMILLKYILSTT